MAWRLGLVLACLLGCGDNRTPPTTDLIGELAVEPVASMSPDKVLAIALAAASDRELVLARATTQGADFCAQCLDPDSTDCGATCRRAVLELTRQRLDGSSPVTFRFRQVFPATREHDVDALDVVLLDGNQAGVAWLECDRALCGGARPRQSCTARYATIDLHTGRTGAVQTLYEGWYGDLRLAFDPRLRRLLAVVGKQRATGAGVRAAVYDVAGARQLAPWKAIGGASARAPAAVPSAGGFLIAVDDPAPERPAPEEPCAEACDCAAPGAPDIATGGLYAYWHGVERPAERIAPGRGVDGRYGAREAIAAIDAGGRVIVASSQASDGAAELFEPAIGGWLRRHASRAPEPQWVAVLGDTSRLAWLGSEPDPDATDAERLVAGAVLIGELEDRGELGNLAPGVVLQAAPVRSDRAVKAAFLLRAVAAPIPSAPPKRFEVIAVRADW